jgi:hypothetical protein
MSTQTSSAQPSRPYAEGVTVLQFIASLVRSLSWPIAVVGLAFMFRKPVTATLARPLRRAKGPAGIELEWDVAEAFTREGVERVEAEIPTTRPSMDEDLELLARMDPGLLVQRRYQEIERELRSLTVPVAPEAAHRFGAHGVASIAHKKGLISDATLRTVEGMSVMYSLATQRTQELTPERAIEYAALADAVMFAIRHETSTLERCPEG